MSAQANTGRDGRHRHDEPCVGTASRDRRQRRPRAANGDTLAILYAEVTRMTDVPSTPRSGS